MRPSSIKPVDLAKGRETIVEFKQEAPIAARYPDRIASFEISEHELANIWMFAPFPSYPREARERHEEGRVQVGVTIGKSGEAQNVKIVKSSGHSYLDQAALRAVALWRAHKEYAGRKFDFPIIFTLARKF